MSVSVAKLGKVIFGGWFVAAMSLMLAVVMLVAALQGGGLGAVLVPWSTGLFAGALLSFGVGTKTSSLQRALMVEGRGRTASDAEPADSRKGGSSGSGRTSAAWPMSCTGRRCTG